MQTKYVVVIGSLLSGIGKGVVTASITKILGMYGYNAMPLKFDGYLNYDCGTMNPYRHGEVFVLEDGSEVDMDFGEYERFIDRDFNNAFSLTGGKVFSEIISNERKGKFLGRDVQIIPHVTDFIIDRVEKTAEDNKLEVMVIEVGGTVGDIENSYFVEAMRQLALKRKVVFVNTTFVPELETVGEQKTKPTQIAMRGLMQAGIQPNFIVCRSKNKLTAETRNKIAYFANLPKEAIIDDHDLENIYKIPLDFIRQGFDKLILSALELDSGRINKEELESWDSNSKAINAGNDILNIAIVGKYMSLHDSYKSVKEAIVHSAASNNVKVNLNWIESEELEGEGESRIRETLGTNDGIIVPGGFGGRGIEGMINTVRYCRENGVPYLGLCLGMQVMAIEFARNVCNIEGSNSAEFDKGRKTK
jgi:CTP synthase (UTP-ammonia lyase)